PRRCSRERGNRSGPAGRCDQWLFAEWRRKGWIERSHPRSKERNDELGRRCARGADAGGRLAVGGGNAHRRSAARLAPDLFALTDVLLARSQAHRFALSPPGGLKWPPDRIGGWADGVEDAARQWSVWVEDEGRNGGVPDLLAQEWEVFREGVEAPLHHVSEAHDWRMCEALLTLHAIADEACAGLGVALTASDGKGCVY